MSLFPAYSASKAGGKEKSDAISSKTSTSLFPAFSGQPAPLPVDNLIADDGAGKSTPTRTTYSSYQPEILEVWQETRKAQLEILLSSEDSEADSDSNDSDVQIIEDKRKDGKRSKKKKDKKRKESKKKKKKQKDDDNRDRDRNKRKKSSKDKGHRRSRSRSPGKVSKKPKIDPNPPHDNSYLEHLPRGRANFLEDIPNLKSQDAYRLDRRPDNDNRAFNSLYATQVPKYTFRDVIDTTRSTRDRPVRPPKKVKRYFKNISKKKKTTGTDVATTERSNLIYPTEILENGQEYIPVPADWNELPNEINSESGIRFRSMESDQQISRVPPLFTREQIFHELTAEFNHQIAKKGSGPDSTQLWIDFIRFQDLILSGPLSGFLGSLRKFSAEKKFAIAEKALEVNRKSVHLHLVCLKLLSSFYAELGQKIGDVDSEWRRVCFLFPNIPQLWFDAARFTFRAQSVIAFRANSRTKKIFSSGFKNLSGKVLEGDFVSHEVKREELERRCVDLLDMVAKFLRSSDQKEKAMGLWQAVLEFNLFTPNGMSLEEETFEDWFLPFEQFWDSGLTRIGEFSPITWSSFRSATLSGQISSLQAPKDPRNAQFFNHDALLDEMENSVIKGICEKEEVLEISQIWLHLERLRGQLHWLPASSGAPLGASMEDVEDLERIVLSDEDVKPFLVRLRTKQAKSYLVLKCLEFVGVETTTGALGSAGSTSRFECEGEEDSTKRDPLYESTTVFPKLFSTHYRSSSNRRFEFPSESIVFGKFGLSGLLTPQLDDSGLMLRIEDQSSRTADSTVLNARDAFIGNFLEKMVEFWKDDEREKRDLVLIWIRYKVARLRRGLEKKKAVRKFIKDFLREEAFRSNLDLWFAYASFEFEFESRDAGRKFFASTLNLVLGNSGTQRELLQFVLGYIRLELDLDQVMSHFLYHQGKGVVAGSCPVCARRVSANISENLNLETEEETKKKNTMLRFLVSVVTGNADGLADLKTVGSVEIVRIVKILEEKCCGGDRKIEDVQARVMVEYLSKGIDNVSKLLERFSASENRSHLLLHLQLLLHAYSQLLGATTGPGRHILPTTSRALITQAQSVIKSALEFFPADPLFLSLMVSIEISFNSLWFRLRRSFGSSSGAFEAYLVKKYLKKTAFDEELVGEVSQEAAWNRFIASLHGELAILDRITEAQDLNQTAYDLNSGILNRIRHLFERALHYRDSGEEETPSSTGASSNCTATSTTMDDDWLYGKSLADCPTLWRLFLRFEIKCAQSRGDTTSGKAILYRALQHCANEKALYLDGVNFFPDLYQEFIDILTDKQMRIRTTPEEVEMFTQAYRDKKVAKE